MKQIISYIVFIILLYLFLFDPPFFMVRGALRFSNLFLILAFFYHSFNKKDYFSFLRLYKRELQLFLLLYIFIILRCAIELEVSFINRTTMAFLNLFLVVPFFFNFAKKKGFFTEVQVVRALLLTCTLASFISIACLTNPSLQEYIKYSVVKMTENDYLYYNQYRGFGLASYLTSNYGFILGFIAGMGCFYLKTNKWFLFCVPIIVVAGIVNCRTSFLITLFIIGIMLFNTKRVLSSSFVVLLGIFVFFFFGNIISLLDLSDRTIVWLDSFGQQLSSISAGDISGTEADDLFGRMIIWPESIDQWALGRGYDIFINKDGVGNSDVGWIRQLNFGGIFYIFIFYTFFVILLKRLYFNGQLYFLLVFLVTFCIVNTKSLCYPGDTLFVLLMIFYFLKVKQGKKVHINSIQQ